MRLESIRVEAVADPWADEGPGRIEVQGRWVKVAEILDRWYQCESLPEWPRADYFKVTDPEGHAYLLKHDREVDEWFLGCCWPARDATAGAATEGAGTAPL